MMQMMECTPEQIRQLKAIASKKSQFNDPHSSYNPSAARYSVVDDDGVVLGFVQGYDTFYVEEFFINQDLPLRKKVEVFRWTVENFLNIMKQLNKKVWWITKKDHKSANNVFHDNGVKVINYRKLRVWTNG